VLEWNSGRLPQAEEQYRAALAIDRKLLDQHPDDALRRQNLGEHWSGVGMVLQAAGEFGKAEAAFDEAIKLAGEASARRPDSPEVSSALVGYHGSRAQLRLATGRVPEAGGEFREALKLAQQVHDRFPARPGVTQQLVVCHLNLGSFVQQHGSLDEAARILEEGVGCARRQVADYPTVLENHSELGTILVSLALVRARQQNPAAARALLEEAIPHQQTVCKSYPDRVHDRRTLEQEHFLLATIARNQGDHRAAAGGAEQVAQLAVRGPADRVVAAGFLAACIPLAEKDDTLSATARKDLARHYGDRAMALLQLARDGGFFKEPGNVEILKKEPAVKALEPRADYRKFLEEVGKE
jgi:tetratricopeptide (TPR) repeat protein